jgi:ribonucleoside-diphosphate reductase alpha chain
MGSDRKAGAHLRAVGSGKAARKRRVRERKGVSIPRYFTSAGADPFDAIEWERRDAKITGERGEVVFEQTDIEVPASWSQLATNVVASKYFRGHLGTPASSA